ncbi:Ankyrin repeat incomplete domain containing protein [Pandoravirus salinus]|uniref:Ankyrin repeat incomplete domain containing protein n=1 Tax=Pandoravirus salinus TaxID=1349410 RepID=S4W462_9VIRU|nr:ankyrin repeat incomplete domain [Pandoravirus salinus]AGO85115.1 Ankyrin repeat incomplete domain containing protein [Pandoravirus salinus]
MAMIIGRLGDKDFCSARSAHSCFRVSTAQQVEARAARWRGCTKLDEFAARGNAEAVVQFLRRFPVSIGEVRRCCAAVSRRGHLDVVRAVQNKQAFDGALVCYEAARGGHVHILRYAQGQGWLDAEQAALGAAYGDALDTFAWVCESAGVHPTSAHVDAALDRGSDQVLVHCLTAGVDGVDREALAVKVVRGHGYLHTRGFPKTLALLLADPSMTADRWPRAVAQMCRTDDFHTIETVYAQWPHLFATEAMNVAVEYGNTPVVSWLYERGVRACDRRALSGAVDRRHDKTVQFVCAHDIDVDRRDAIYRAACAGDASLLAVLLDGQGHEGFYAAYHGAARRAMDRPDDTHLFVWLHKRAPSP